MHDEPEQGVISQMFNTETYLARLGHTGPVQADLRTLRELHRKHMINIPFDNSLNAHFDTALAIDDPRPPLSICFVWSKMCADKLLRDKLFRSGRILSYTQVPVLLQYERVVHVLYPNPRGYVHVLPLRVWIQGRGIPKRIWHSIHVSPSSRASLFYECQR